MGGPVDQAAQAVEQTAEVAGETAQSMTEKAVDLFFGTWDRLAEGDPMVWFAFFAVAGFVLLILRAVFVWRKKGAG